MAMQFNRAEQAQMPDYVRAAALDAEVAQQKRNADQLRQQGLMTGAGTIGKGAKDMGWLDKLKTGSAKTPPPPTATPPPTVAAAAPSVAGMLGGASSAAPAMSAVTPAATQAIMGGAAPMMSAAAPSAMAAAAPAAASTAPLAATAPALMSNPVGWGVLGALAISAMMAS